MSNIIPCRVIKDFDKHKPGDTLQLNVLLAEKLANEGQIEILWSQMNHSLIGDRIVELADKEIDMLRELISTTPDEVTRQVYKRKLKKLESGDLRL